MNPKAYNKPKWPRKNLGEVVNFLEDRHPDGLSLKAVADTIGAKPESVSNTFRRDDMRLSRAERLAECYGYRLVISYPVRRLDEGYEPAAPRKTYDNAGNLAGLVKYINDSEYGIPFVAEKAGITANTVRHAFTTGDTMISTLNRMLDALGIFAMWKFEKVQ